jgi:hypothetical protein
MEAERLACFESLALGFDLKVCGTDVKEVMMRLMLYLDG